MAKFCIKCGTPLADGDAFCMSCGQAANQPSQPAEQPAPPPPPAQPAVPQYAAPPQAPPAQPQYAAPPQPAPTQPPPPQAPAQPQYAAPPPQQPAQPQYAAPPPGQPPQQQHSYRQPPPPQQQYASAPAAGKKKSMLPLILIIAGAAAAVIVVLILTGVFPVGSNSSDKNDQPGAGAWGSDEPSDSVDLPSEDPSGSEEPSDSEGSSLDFGLGGLGFGDKWPDNEFTKNLPKPKIPILQVMDYDGDFYVIFDSTNVKEVKAYVEQLKAAGFTSDVYEDEWDYEGETFYSFTGRSAVGLEVSIVVAGGSATMSVIKK